MLKLIKLVIKNRKVIYNIINQARKVYTNYRMNKNNMKLTVADFVNLSNENDQLKIIKNGKVIKTLRKKAFTPINKNLGKQTIVATSADGNNSQ